MDRHGNFPVSSVALAVGAGIVIVDGTLGSLFTILGATGNITVNVKNVRPGQEVILYFAQDAVGGRTLTTDVATPSVQTPRFGDLQANFVPSLAPLSKTFYRIVGITDAVCFITQSSSGVVNVQTGVATLVAGTVTIAATITADSKITLGLRDFGAGAITDMTGLWMPFASRTATGFVVNAVDGAKALIVTAVCTFDWHIIG